MLMLSFMLAFSIYQGRQGSSLWWSALAMLCMQIIGIALSTREYVARGLSASDILTSTEWGSMAGRFVFFVAFFCGVQALTRRFVSRHKAPLDLPPV
jgi:hypothetical protein